MNLFQRFAALLALSSATISAVGLKATISGIKDMTGSLDGLKAVPDFDIPCDDNSLNQLAQIEGLLEQLKNAIH